MPACFSNRLKRRAEFLRVARDGRKTARASLIMQSLQAEGGSETRAGFTATKRVGNAVERNRTKRRLRAALRLTVKGHDCNAADVVLVGRAATRKLPFEQILNDVDSALRKLGVLS